MEDSLINILSLLENYKYLIILPLTIVEGPIITIICGFLVFLGIMKFWIVFPVLVLADVTGDCIYYFIGRYSLRSDWARRYASFLGYTKESEFLIENHFRNHKFQTFLFAKFAHGVGAMIQVASGIAKVNFLYFFVFSLFSTLLKASILVSIGFYAGSSIAKIDGFLSILAFVVFGTFILFIGGYILLNKHIKRFFQS